MDPSLHQAIHQTIEIVSYDPAWPAQFQLEKSRLTKLFPELTQIEHFGSTAVPGLSAKPVIDILAIVPSMNAADAVLPQLCENGYTTSLEFNATLGDRRWLMRHSAGRRTHHLHLVLPNSTHWQTSLRFRDMLRTNSQLASEYTILKQSLVELHVADREAYTAAKGEFIERSLTRS